MVDPSPLAPLDYAPAPPRRWKWVRRWVGLVVLLAMIAAGWRWGPGAWHRVQVVYWQGICLAHVLPGDQVVYEEPSAGNAQRASDPQYITYPRQKLYGASRIGIPQGNVTAYEPRAWAELVSLVPAVAARPAPASFLPPPNAPRGVLFMHERISPAGNRRLVVIRYLANASGTRPESFLGYNFDPRVFIPGNLAGPAIAVPRDITPGGLSSDGSPLPALKIFAGQPDVNEASRFTIRFLADGVERIVDGELDDQDRITLTLRPVNPSQRARRIVY